MAVDPAVTKRQLDKDRHLAKDVNIGKDLPNWITENVIDNDLSGIQSEKFTARLKNLLDQIEYVIPVEDEAVKVKYYQDVVAVMTEISIIRMMLVESSNTLAEVQKKERKQDIRLNLKISILDLADILGSIKASDVEE